MKRRLFSRAVTLTVVAVLALVNVGSALAGTYWNYSNWLPLIPGFTDRYYVQYTSGGSGMKQDIRMSWTVNSHAMDFLTIRSNGNWEWLRTYGPPWDVITTRDIRSIYDKFGCRNPAGLSQVWVNCKVFPARYP